MAKIQYTYVPLDKATIIDRRHQREVQPPGMVNLENFIPSRSDNTPSMRPDWWFTSDQIYAMSDVLELPGTSTLRDTLNSANGLYGSDQVTFFTTYIPYGNDNGTIRILSGTHDDGTVSASSGQSVVTGVGTTVLQNAHRGAIFKVDGVYDAGYSGGYYTWGLSSNGTKEYYMTSQSGADPSILGDGIASVVYYGTSGLTPTPGVAGSLTNGEWNLGDNDTLGYNTLYFRNNDDDPDDDVSNTGYLALVQTCIDISGSNYEWTASGSGTNEYYYRTRAAGDPGITGDAASSAGASSYFAVDGSTAGVTNSLFSHYETLTAGTVGSLSNLEFGIDDNDTLGYDTVYIRDNTGDPDTRGWPIKPRLARVYASIDITGAAYKWTPSVASPGAYYCELSGGGNPSLTGPTLVTVDGTTQTSDPSPESDGDYYFGDNDTLGYSTVYVYSSAGNPDAVGSTILAIYANNLYGSSHKWTASGSGTDEYYLEAVGGGTPGLTQPNSVYNYTTKWSKGTLGALGVSEWGFGDNDTLGYSTVYVRYGSDPDTASLQLSANYQYRVYCGNYQWTSSGSGTNEYYLDAVGGGDPSVTAPTSVYIDGAAADEGTVGSLTDGEWDYGDNDSLGYSTVYIRRDSADPDGAAGTGTVAYTTIPAQVSKLDASSIASDYYIVDKIDSDTSFIVYGEIDRAFLSADPTFYYNHNPFLANQYKLNIQAYTSGLIYNAPTINDNLNEEDISGPFYADLLAGEWSYSSKVITDTVMSGTGITKENQYTYATNGGSYIQVWPQFPTSSATLIGSDNRRIGISYGLTKDSWTDQWWYEDANLDRELTVTVSGDGDDMRLTSIDSNGGTYLCAANVTALGVSTYPGIARATDGIGLNWTVAADTGFAAWTDVNGEYKEATEFQTISATYNGSITGRIVTLNWRASDDRIHVRYSDDLGASWNDVAIDGGNTYFTGSVKSKVKYINGQFVIIDDTALIYGNGATFTTQAISGVDKLRDVAFNDDDTYVIVEEDFKVWYSDSTGITGTWTAVTLPLDNSSYEETNFIIYDTIGERFVVNSTDCFFWSDDGEDWGGTFFEPRINDNSFYPATNIISDAGGLTFCTAEAQGEGNAREDVRLNRFSFNYWDVVDFVPLSDIYRASTFSVLDGYVVLLGTREWDDSAEEWTYYPRRIRWTAPATYNDFSGEGSGTADANGEGAFLDSRPVNGRIVVFETNRVSAVVPRGFTEDPWDYDVVKEDFRILSNPVAVDDMCYVIGTDGLLYATDGVEVQETGSSFDITKFDDFNEDKPITLDYSRQFNALVAYYFEPGASENFAYLISLSGGSVTKIGMPVFTDSSETLAENCAFITAVGDSSDQRLIASYHPFSTDTDNVTTLSLTTGSPITGKSVPVRASGTNNVYSYSTLETGEIYLVPEGQKTSLKNIIVRTYTESEWASNDDRPRIVILVKSIEDDDWHVSGQDVYSSYAMTDATCPAASPGASSFSNLIYEGTGGGGGALAIQIPGGDARLARIYSYDGDEYTLLVAGTDYTFVDNGADGYDAELVSAPAAGTDIYAYWSGYPEIKVESGDFYVSSEGLHRVTGTTGTAVDGGLTMDRYLSAGSEESVSTHYPSVQLPDGEGETKVGINKLVEGVKVKILVIPEYGGDDTSTTVKVTGITLGHIPQGRKTLQATGS